MNYTLEDYETAVLAWLEPMTYLKTLKGYAGELDEQQALEQFRRGFPGVLVGIDAAEIEVAEMPFAAETVTVNLVVGDRSYRSQNDARSAGVYRILDDLRSRVLGSKMDMDILPVLGFSVDKLPLCTTNLVLYQVSFEIYNDRVEVEVEG